MILTDDSPDPRKQPTRVNVLDAMHWLVRGARPHDSLFFHCALVSISAGSLYDSRDVSADSGHGSQVKDTNGDEIDGYDEGVFPLGCGVPGES